MLSRTQINHIRQLADGRHRQETCTFVAEGIKTVAELVQSQIEIIRLYCTEAQSKHSWLQGIGDKVQIISEMHMQKISHMHTAPGLLATCRLPQHTFTASELENTFALVLDGISDPGNLGTIIRTADWFGISLIFCSNTSADPWQPKVVQSAMGSLFRTRVIRTDIKSLLYTAKERNVLIYGAFTHGQSIYEAPIKSSGSLLLIGSESHGISIDLKLMVDIPVTIPRSEISAAESLNAAVATAIIVNEFKKPKHSIR